MGELDDISVDLAQLVRLAISEQADDVRLFVARLVRKYRDTNPGLAEQLDQFLRTKPSRTNGVLRKEAKFNTANQVVPLDEESRLSLLKVVDGLVRQPPLLSGEIKDTLVQIIKEREQIERLESLGLRPTRSAIFVGKPGVGKTMTAHWLASQLQLPLYVLDLTAVMSSLLGRSGSNLRAALDFAKNTPCVLLLDEIDAIAKRRSDDTDVGELKRLVTVILQEVDEWPTAGLLLAATNFPELIDPAIWRRFDAIIHFKLPDTFAVENAIKRFLGTDAETFSRWIDVLTLIFSEQSFSDIEREIYKFRRAIAVGAENDERLIEEFIRNRAASLDHSSRIELAISLAKSTDMSQHTISEVTKVSRDTIRKHTPQKGQAKRRSAA